MRVIKVSFMHSGTFLLSNMQVTSLHTKFLTFAQKYWKKPAWRPSTLGALNGLRAHSPCLISYSTMWVLSQFLSSSDRKQQAKYSISERTVEKPIPISNNLWYSNKMKFLTPVSSVILCLLARVETWKKEVLRSPWAAQLRRDFRAQNSSSCCMIAEYSSVKSLSSWMRNWLGPLTRAFWTP